MTTMSNIYSVLISTRHLAKYYINYVLWTTLPTRTITYPKFTNENTEA